MSEMVSWGFNILWLLVGGYGVMRFCKAPEMLAEGAYPAFGYRSDEMEARHALKKARKLIKDGKNEASKNEIYKVLEQYPATNSATSIRKYIKEDDFHNVIINPLLIKAICNDMAHSSNQR